MHSHGYSPALADRMTNSCPNSQESLQYLGKDSHLIWKHLITERLSKKKKMGEKKFQKLSSGDH